MKQLLDTDLKTLDFSNSLDFYEIPLNFQIASLNLTLITQNFSSPMTLIFTDSASLEKSTNVSQFSNEMCGVNATFCQKSELSANQTNNINISMSFLVDIPLDKVFIYVWSTTTISTNYSAVQIQLLMKYPPKNIILNEGMIKS